MTCRPLFDVVFGLLLTLLAALQAHAGTTADVRVIEVTMPNGVNRTAYSTDQDIYRFQTDQINGTYGDKLSPTLFQVLEPLYRGVRVQLPSSFWTRKSSEKLIEALAAASPAAPASHYPVAGTAGIAG